MLLNQSKHFHLAEVFAIQLVILLTGLFFFFVAAEMSDNPLLPFREAFNMTVNGKWWIVALFVLEVLRQIHFFFCEHSAGYYRFWQQHIFGRWNKHTGKFNSYTRYRVARALKVVIAILVVPMILCAALLAALWPAAAAVRGSLVEALEYE